MRFPKIWVLSSICLSLLSLNVLASETYKKEYEFAPEWRSFMEFSYNTGGDGTETLPLFNRADGQFYSGIPIRVIGYWTGYENLEPMQDEIEAGGVIKFAGGVEFPLTESVSVSGSLGYMFDEIEGDLMDGSGGRGIISISRFTSDLMAFYNMGAHRLGLGASIHFSPKFTHEEEADGFKLKSTYNFDSAVGATLQYDFKVSDNTSLGARYTTMSYDITDFSVRYRVGAANTNIDIACSEGCEDLVEADHFGVHITYRF